MRAEQSDITQQREQLYRKMEVLSSQGLLISPNVALPMGVAVSHDEISPPEEALSSPSLSSPQTSEHSMSTTASATSLHSQGTERRKVDAKWSKSKKEIHFRHKISDIKFVCRCD